MSKFKEDENLVSVIIPCYNSEKNIEQALISLEKQSYKYFNVIIINDGSNDNTDYIIKNYMKLSKMKIDYIKQENAGVSKARNVGLSRANSKYIMFLDSDDVYHKDCIQILVNAMESNNIDAAYSCYSRNIKGIINGNSLTKEHSKIDLSHNELLDNFMYRRGPCCFVNYIYKRQILVENNILFETGVKYGEDLEFIWKYLTHCKSGIYIDKALYGYYNNPNSAMNNISWYNTDVIYAVQRVEKYLEINNDEFINKFKGYMLDRTVWSVAKEFARSNELSLYKRLLKEIDVKKSMKNMSKKGPNIFIKFSARIFCISPSLFFYCIKIL